MERRNFIRSISLLGLTFFVNSKVKAYSLKQNFIYQANEFKIKIIAIIKDLKKEGSNLVKKIMVGKEYVFDPYTHYPYDGGIKDEKTGYQLFFHAHRANEYGHFHTFAVDNNGDLIHLVLISMNEIGEPIGLATVNRWVTGDKFVKADVLKKLSSNFQMDKNLFHDTRVIESINLIFKAYEKEIHQLFDERDEWIKNYAFNNLREPFEDREHEVLSFKALNDFTG